MRTNDGHDSVPAARQLAEFVREELEAPANDLARRTAAILDEAAAKGDAYRDDLARTVKAASHLQRLTAALAERRFDDAAGAADRQGEIRTIRHDLRTPITAILGYGELVAEEAGDNGDAWLGEALADTLGLANRLLTSVEKLSGFARNSGAAGLRAGDAAPASHDSSDETDDAKADGGSGAKRGEAARQPITGRILVVDDNPSMRDLIARRLKRHGHEVATCNSGESALEKSARGGFDLMMLDLLMPGIDGLEVLKRLRERPETQVLPVIVMSALDEVEAAVRCIEAGADDYLSKPLDETLLRARIGSSLERKFLRDREQETLRLLRAEQQRSDDLLHNILPVSVARRLRAGESAIADRFDEVTVLFCDLVGFTRLAADMPPAETLELLAGIFSRFDALADRNGLEKIKTIGDAYMVVGGIPDPIADSARRVVSMAAEMPAVVHGGAHGSMLDIRIGIHTGPAAAGIVGTKKFFYDVWGDTVNTASRLEASCEPGRIHASEATVAAAGGGFRFEPRGPVDLPGKGRMQTFYLKDA
ncbi:adenylate/guanylate cyclase domain-containing protein [Aureimonas leprariae]|uniref:histidine kinase n=1 Tax=Plantimonas leprariae TaxID=2615207 RepID=A0A7V7PRP7_9HYPH|nr:adenylate/guanylate cyclase domain-containing protein [Aureimonas leprariae]KAB0681412.1 response regulator [Aureimonas leprariae]